MYCSQNLADSKREVDRLRLELQEVSLAHTHTQVAQDRLLQSESEVMRLQQLLANERQKRATLVVCYYLPIRVRLFICVVCMLLGVFQTLSKCATRAC